MGACVALGLILSLLAPAGTAVAAEQPRFEFRPHCTAEDEAKSACKTFGVRDAQSFQTDTLKVGDTLDLDLLIKNPGNSSVTRFRAWMSYDPTVFTGSLIEIDKNFPTPDKAEVTFSSNDGYIKAAASVTAGAKGASIVAAHISLKVIKAPVANTVISFYDATKKVDSHTAIIVTIDGKEQNIATGAQSYLFVRLQSGATASSAAQAVSSAAQSSASMQAGSSVNSSQVTASETSSAASADGGMAVSASSQSSAAASIPTVAFSLLQVQGLRVTTDGSSVFLAWNPLNAGNIAGYNVYYGTVSGKYIQRRSVDKNNTTLTLRALPVGIQYYFAVRGVDANNQESDFSQEVGVVIGQPNTSTSPLTGSVADMGPGGKAPGNGGKINGDTGPSSTALLFIALSSVAGLTLAFRRQFTARNISL